MGKSNHKIAILGPRGSGKTYLFHAIVYRTESPDDAGALTRFMADSGILLESAPAHRPPEEGVTPGYGPLPVSEFLGEYRKGNPISRTKEAEQKWYRLKLPFRGGWPSANGIELELEFLDGSGEQLHEARELSESVRKYWRAGYLGADVLLFCLPIWAAFPKAGLDREDKKDVQLFLSRFDRVVRNYRALQAEEGASDAARIILVLTQADDPRSALTGLREHWITPYIDHAVVHQRSLSEGQGLGRYLADARTISVKLAEEFRTSTSRLVKGIPGQLKQGMRAPWIIAISTVEGAHGEVNQLPVPVHVELPLLQVLVDQHNVLM